MDPNENLKEQLEIAKQLLSDIGRCSADDVERLAELVIALDEWIRKGGMLPGRWER